MNDLYQAQDYKAFLRKRLSKLPRGALTKLAKAMGCAPSYLSQVITRKAHLNSDQAWAASDYLGMTDTERNFFLLLIEFSRSQNEGYRRHLKKQMRELTHDRPMLKEKIATQEKLSESDRSLYYSTHLYAAVHILTSIRTFKTREALAKHLGLPLNKISKVIDDLIRMDLIVEKSHTLDMGKGRIHLHADSPLIVQHHTNWRIRALRSIEQNAAKNLHYSSIVSLSAEDAEKLKSEIVDLLMRSGKLIETSPAEKCYVFNLDYFEF